MRPATIKYQGRSSVVVRILLVIAGLFVVLIGISKLINYGREIRNIPTQEGAIAIQWNGKTNMDVIFYQDLETSLTRFYTNYSPLSGFNPPEVDHEIFRLSQDNYLFVVYPVEQWNHVDALACFIVEEESGMISIPQYEWYQGIKALSYDASYKYYDEDRVVRDIIHSYSKPCTSLVNAGYTLYYGVGLDEQMKNLTICDYSPTEVFPFEYKGQTYYFWYYEGNVPFTEIIEENINIEESFVMADLIELFEINFDSAA